MKTTVTREYLAMDLPPVVANKRLPLDQRMRIEEKAAINKNVHCAMTGSVSRATSTAMVVAAQKSVNLRDHFSAMFWAVIAPINNVAVMEVKTAFDLLRTTRYWRQDIKRKAKQTMERIDKYDRAVINNMRHNLNGDRSQYWMDYTDEHLEEMRHDIDIFYLSVLQVLTKFNETDREMKARMVTSHALLNYAIGVFDEYFRKLEQDQHVGLRECYADARLSFVQSSWEQVVDAICVTNKPMDVDNDPQVQLAFKIIETHLLDLDRIGKVGEVAISLNGDLPKENYRNPMNSSEQFQKSFEQCFNQ